MKIVDTIWTPYVNKLIIACTCGAQFDHRTDRWLVRCPCGKVEKIEILRNEWQKHGKQQT